MQSLPPMLPDGVIRRKIEVLLGEAGCPEEARRPRLPANITRVVLSMCAARRENRFEWLAEPLMSDQSYLDRSMFGCLACYFRGKMVLVLADGDEEPWSGIMIPTDRAHHPSLLDEFRFLAPHPVLGKWLYLSEKSDGFERAAAKIVNRIRSEDPRFGIVPGEKRKTRSKRKRSKK